MTHKTADDEASFEGLISFDTVPPPGSGEEGSDVHNARTTVAELPDSFLDSLKSGMKADVESRAAVASGPSSDPAGEAAGYVPRPVAPEPELFAKSASVVVDFSCGPEDIEAALISALETMPPAAGPLPPPVPLPRYQQPYPSPSSAFAVQPASESGLPSSPSPALVQRRLAAVGWREAVVAVLALLVGFGFAMVIRALVVRYLG
jgi:hypothetical protein